MNILITMEDGSLYQLDRDVDVNEIARRGASPGDEIIYRFIDKERIPNNIKDWEYKTDSEIRDLLDDGAKITFVEEYPDIDDDDWYDRQAEREAMEDRQYEEDLHGDSWY